MTIFLVDLQGSQWFSLSPDNQSTTLGRDASQVDGVIEDDSVAPLHAQLTYKEAQWWLEDLHSEDGTYLNGEELEPGHPKAIRAGDRIGLGLGEWLFTEREPIAPLAIEASQQLLELPSPNDKTNPLDLLQSTMRHINKLVQEQQEVQEIIEYFLTMLQDLFAAEVVVLSLEDQLYLQGMDKQDPHGEWVLQFVRFQTQPIAFRSALTPESNQLRAMYAPILFEDLVQGYFYIWAPNEKTWSSQEFAVFASFGEFLSQRISTQRNLKRAQEDREMLNLNLVGVAPAMQRLKLDLLRAAPSHTPVFVCGEGGVGKSRIARAVHQASPRRDAPLMVINAANFPTELFESELCGADSTDANGKARHRPGKAELADQGSLLIEEISEFPLGAQPALVTLIQNGMFTPTGSETAQSVDVRLLATSHLSLDELRKQKKILPELADLLQHVLLVPSLRQRKEDLPQLFRSFLARYGEEEGLPTCVVKDEALAHIQHHRWTSNIRELRDIVANCFYALDPAHPVIEEELMQRVLKEHLEDKTTQRENLLAAKVYELEVRMVQEALMANNDDATAAAESLGLSRIVFRRKMRELGIG